jgi:TPR repeat protein
VGKVGFSCDVNDVVIAYAKLSNVSAHSCAAIHAWSVVGAADRAQTQQQPSKPNLEAACRKGDGLAFGLVDELFHEDEHRAPALLQLGCKAGSAFACAMLAGRYDDGEGTPRDADMALRLSIRACLGHSALGCMNAAKMIAQERGHVPKGQSADANAYIDRACWYGGDRDGVCRASDDSNLGEGEYHQHQLAQCTRGNARACRLLGWDFETGYGTPTNIALALAAYKNACERADVYGCFREALLTADTRQQAQLYQTACQQGSGAACYNATLPIYGVSAEKRSELYRRACESDVVAGCMAFASQLTK